MKEYEFWRERETGEIWAIELGDGAVVGCCGPFDHSELEERFLAAFDYDCGRASWIEEHRGAFDLYDPVRGESLERLEARHDA